MRGGSRTQIDLHMADVPLAPPPSPNALVLRAITAPRPAERAKDTGNVALLVRLPVRRRPPGREALGSDSGRGVARG